MPYLLALSLISNAVLVVCFLRHLAALEGRQAEERKELYVRIQSPESAPVIAHEDSDVQLYMTEDEEDEEFARNITKARELIEAEA